MTIEEICPKCNQECEVDAVACDQCDNWFHFTCVNLVQRQVQRIDNFFCTSCTTPTRYTTWKRKDATLRQKALKNKEYHEVEAIHDHRYLHDTRQFLVEWKGCLSPRSRVNVRTWEPESHLDGAIDLLQLYCMTKEIPLSEIEGLQGAAPSTESANIDNWVTMSALLPKFEQTRRRLKVKSDLVASEWFEFGSKDQLYFLRYEQHFFVLLHITSRNLALIADGGNMFKTREDIANEIRELLGIRLVALPFDMQLRVDHCASSAILIGLDLLRMHSSGIRFKKLSGSKILRAELNTFFHKKESSLLNLPALHSRCERLVCQFCGKSYTSKQGRSLAQHIKRTHK